MTNELDGLSSFIEKTEFCIMEKQPNVNLEIEILRFQQETDLSSTLDD